MLVCREVWAYEVVFSFFLFLTAGKFSGVDFSYFMGFYFSSPSLCGGQRGYAVL